MIDNCYRWRMTKKTSTKMLKLPMNSFKRNLLVFVRRFDTWLHYYTVRTMDFSGWTFSEKGESGSMIFWDFKSIKIFTEFWKVLKLIILSEVPHDIPVFLILLNLLLKLFCSKTKIKLLPGGYCPRWWLKKKNVDKTNNNLWVTFYMCNLTSLKLALNSQHTIKKKKSTTFSLKLVYKVHLMHTKKSEY